MFDKVFPERAPVERKLVDNRRVFKAYRGRCRVNIVNHGVLAARIFINGKLIASVEGGEIVCSAGKSSGSAVADAGAVARDGYNTLRVQDIELTAAGGFIEVWPDFPELVSGIPADAGFDGKKLEKIDDLINDEVERGFPGAALCIVKNGRIIKNSAYGYKCKYRGSDLLPARDWQPMATGTLFDMASNTKIYATVLPLMHLMYSGAIGSVDDRVGKYLDGFDDGAKRELTLRDLLTHQAGFAPEYRTYNPDAVPQGCYSQERNHTVRLLKELLPVTPRGQETRYSDTDFMLLGLIIEAVTGMPQDVYTEQHIFRPLGLGKTLFNPLRKGFCPEDCAATERQGNSRDGYVGFPNIRRYTLQGEVHDEKAWYAMEGVAGHAGLFSTADEIAVLMQCVLNGGGYGSMELFDERLTELFSCGNEKALRFGLGWNKMGTDTTWEFGPYAGALTIGHSGWTGTVTAIDRENDLAVALLTNCIHSPYMKDKEQFVHKYPPFETGRFGSVMALIYEAFMEA